MTNEPTTWQVLKIDEGYYLIGVREDECGIESIDEHTRKAPGIYLLARYDEGDCDRPYNKKLMLSALYDVYQTHDGWAKDGDVIETPHGRFKCGKVDVWEDVYEMPHEAKARRARLRRLGRKFAKVDPRSPDRDCVPGR